MKQNQVPQKVRTLVMATALAGLLFCAPANARQQSAGPFSQRVMSAVVRVTGYMDSAESENGHREYAQSSGFFCGDGLILTAYSTFVDTEKRQLCEEFNLALFDGTTIKANILSIEPALDFVILKITEEYQHQILDISTPPDIGVAEQVWALAAKMPDGGPSSFSGLVKARDETSIYSEGFNDQLINTYMELPEYAYGGPLVNARGEVLGINVHYSHLDAAGQEVSGEEHAVPISSVKAIYKVLLANPTFEQKWLGFSTRRISMQQGELTKQLMQRRGGVSIDFVWSEGQAAQTDIRSGDILVRMNGNRVLTPTHFKRLLFEIPNNTKVSLEIIRNGAIQGKESQAQKRPRWAAPQ